MILAGDIGGTKTLLALFDADLRPLAEKSYSSREHEGLGGIIRAFLAETGLTFRRACFGIAGPVRHGRAKTTNLPWIVDVSDLRRDLGTKEVHLINDLEATAHGIPALTEGDLMVLNQGEPSAEGNAALIAAGTGLGEAGLYWDGREHRPFATEGGHASFSPRNERELDLLRHLLRQFDPVSWERVVSGPGLFHIYRFLRDQSGGEEPAWLAEQMRSGDPVSVISRVGLDGTWPLCEEALDLFVSLYGAEAGNLALKIMATGGVYLGGGIAPKILPKLKGTRFLEPFAEKGRMRPLLEAMPVKVILSDRTALTGAARYAARADGRS